MASNQGRKGLGKPTGDTLNAIDDALAWLVESAKQNQIAPDEFTVEMAAEKLKLAGCNDSNDSIRSRFRRMIKEGQMTRRRASLEGHVTYVYRRVI